jgi:LPXTG-motif cell wall-anchored protein
MMRTVAAALVITVFGLVSAPSARADEYNKKTVITFSQPVELPGRVLPAGTYVFRLADSMSDRHIVQVFTADESQILATLMAIPDYRLTPTDQTVIKFNEVRRGAPEPIRAWFYPGNTVGQEFVYPKARATELAKASKAVVPALAVDVTDVAALKTAPIVAITPEATEVPITAAIQTSPRERVATLAMVPNGSSVTGTTGVTQTGQPARRNTRQLPKTASALPLIALLGFASLGVASGLMVFRKRATATAV